MDEIFNKSHLSVIFLSIEMWKHSRTSMINRRLRCTVTPKEDCRKVSSTYKSPSCSNFCTVWLANKNHRNMFKTGLRPFHLKKEIARAQQWQCVCFLAQLRAHHSLLTPSSLRDSSLSQRLPTFVTPYNLFIFYSRHTHILSTVVVFSLKPKKPLRPVKCF